MHNIGYESYQDSRLIPPEYWADDTPDPEAIAAELAEKYRAQALAELQAAHQAGEIDLPTEADIYDAALEIAAEHGETVRRIIARHEADRADAEREYYAW